MDERQDLPEPEAEARAAMPRWVKASLIVVAALVMLLIVAKATGLGGEHGPGRHGGGNDTPTEQGGGHRSPIDRGP